MSDKRNQVEHRFDRRVAVAFPVTLYSRNNPPVLAHVFNLGRGGALIAADERLFPRYTMLYVDFIDRCRIARDAAIIPALVIHGEAHGLGVMFTQELPDMVYRDTIVHSFSQSPLPAAA